MDKDNLPHWARGLGPLGFDQICDRVIETGTPPEAARLLGEIESLSPDSRKLARIAIAGLLDLDQSETIKHPKNTANGPIEEQICNNAVSVWETSSMALFRDGDPVPLANLLLMGLPAPVEVTQLIGRMLHPRPGYLGFRLDIGRDKRMVFWTDAAEDIGKKLKCARRYQELMSEVPRKTRKKILHELMLEFDRRRSWVEEAITMDPGEVVRKSGVMLGINDSDESS